MSALDKTMYFDFGQNEKKDVHQTLETVYNSLEEKGYNPINQIVGYLMSGDLAYISSYKDARKKMSSLDREKILEALLVSYLKGE